MSEKKEEKEEVSKELFGKIYDIQIYV